MIHEPELLIFRDNALVMEAEIKAALYLFFQQQRPDDLIVLECATFSKNPKLNCFLVLRFVTLLFEVIVMTVK